MKEGEIWREFLNSTIKLLNRYSIGFDGWIVLKTSLPNIINVQPINVQTLSAQVIF